MNQNQETIKTSEKFENGQHNAMMLPRTKNTDRVLETGKAAVIGVMLPNDLRMYVGSGIDGRSELNRIRRSLGNQTFANKKFMAAVVEAANDMGTTVETYVYKHMKFFFLKVLDNRFTSCTEGTLRTLETQYINKYNTVNEGFNNAPAAIGTHGLAHTALSIEKMKWAKEANKAVVVDKQLVEVSDAELTMIRKGTYIAPTSTKTETKNTKKTTK